MALFPDCNPHSLQRKHGSRAHSLLVWSLHITVCAWVVSVSAYWAAVLAIGDVFILVACPLWYIMLQSHKR